mgnify:CR=1 FL=1
MSRVVRTIVASLMIWSLLAGACGSRGSFRERAQEQASHNQLAGWVGGRSNG